MSTYCEYCRNHPEDELNGHYHDEQYGYPIDDDNGLFERLILEINQAGLSWITILRKAPNFRNSYHNFDIQKVASYGEQDRTRLLSDAGIIRNRLKINAAIENANRILKIKEDFGSFKKWLDKNQSSSLTEWTRLFKKTFVFTGEKIVKEFLISTGYLPGAHEETCAIFIRIALQKPKWMEL